MYNIRNKIRNYVKIKKELFKRKYFLILDVIYGLFDRVDDAVNDSLDSFTNKFLDDSKVLISTNMEDKSKVSSSLDKLQPIMTDEEFRKLGIDIDDEECITGIQEFKKELSMDNFPQTKKNSGPVRRLVPKRDIN